MKLINKINEYFLLVRLNKPIGTFLLLWPTLWALWIAQKGTPSAYLCFSFTAGVILMRSSGCAINDWADWKFDKYVARTQDRPLAKETLKPWEALLCSFLLAFLAFLLILPMRTGMIWLSATGGLITASYPFLKRFFPVPQFYLGIAFSWGIPMIFYETYASIPRIAWILLLANLFWVLAYDTEYAMIDREEDKKIGLHSSAIFFGKYDIVSIIIFYLISLALLFYVGLHEKFSSLYYLGISFLIPTIIYYFTLIRSRNRKKCFRAFNRNNIYGAIVFLSIYINYFNFSGKISF